MTDQVPEIGDLLPATVGDYGLHVQRQPDGSLRAAFNVLQHGSCWTIPAQCRGGHKTACPYVSCGFSLDTDALTAENGRPTREMRQFIGFNPAKLAPAPLATVGPFVFVHLGPEEPAPPGLGDRGLDEVRGRFADQGYLGRCWVKLDVNWKVALRAVAVSLGASDDPKHAEGPVVVSDLVDEGDLPRMWASHGAPAGPSHNDEAQRGVIGRFYRVFPTFAAAVLPDFAVGMVVKPTSPGSCLVLVAIYAPAAREGHEHPGTGSLLDAWAQSCRDAVPRAATHRIG